MKERPIIFSNEMVQAILDGRKTQTRRVIKTTKKTEWLLTYNWTDEYIKNPDNYLVDDCPYGAIGDRLWVRETWYNSIHSDGFSEDGYEIVHDCAAYKSTGTFQCGKDDPIAYKRKYKSPIFMPRWASRITLEITDIRVERVQEISEEDAKSEGIDYLFDYRDCDTVAGLIGTKPKDHGYKNYLWHGDYGSWGMGNKQSDSWSYQYSSYKDAAGSFSSLWEKINAKRGYPWDSNPWVWVIEFKRLP